MSASYDLADEPAHLHAIDVLAEEANQPVEVVTEIYITELARLKVGARIEDFLLVLTCRKVREALRRGIVSVPLSGHRSAPPAVASRRETRAHERLA